MFYVFFFKFLYLGLKNRGQSGMQSHPLRVQGLSHDVGKYEFTRFRLYTHAYQTRSNLNHNQYVNPNYAW